MYDATIEINGNEYEVRATYTYYRGMKGKKDNFGVGLEPNEPARVEVDCVEINYSMLEEAPDYRPIKLPPEIIWDLEGEILEQYQ